MDKTLLETLIKKEGDYFEWVNVIECHIQRNKMGVWCGYTIIPNSFPRVASELSSEILVHGGITYESKDDDGNIKVGFDCGHFDDFVPLMLNIPGVSDITFSGEYRNKEYVINEVNSMVEQILNLKEIKRHLTINKILS